MKRLRMIVRLVSAALSACLLIAAQPAQAKTILFVGNSFTFGAGSPVMRFRPDRVIDLNGEGIGGVPALFKTFALQAGLDWTVSLETSPGRDLKWHLDNRAAMIDRPWDVVILQGHSLLNAQKPGDPTLHIAAAVALAEILRRANPKVQIDLVSSWSRADQTLRPGGFWYGKPIARMAEDIAAANAKALATSPLLHSAIAVGGAWNRAMRDGIADADPYDGLEFGKTDLWTYDQYHASATGYYLEALMVFGAVTGFDPRKLPEREQAATDLGLDPRIAARLRTVAAEELNFPAQPVAR